MAGNVAGNDDRRWKLHALPRRLVDLASRPRDVVVRLLERKSPRGVGVG